MGVKRGVNLSAEYHVPAAVMPADALDAARDSPPQESMEDQ